MAVINSVIDLPEASNTIRRAKWTPLTFTGLDSGAPFEFPDWADRAIQVYGTFGAGGTIVIEGSNDGIAWATMTDQNGGNMSYTTATLKQMTEAPLYIRPRVTAGDATTSLTVVLVSRRLYQLF